MYHVIWWWVMACVVLFGLGVWGLRVGWEVIKLGLVVAFAIGVFALVGCTTMTPQERHEWSEYKKTQRFDVKEGMAACIANNMVVYKAREPVRNMREWTCMTTRRLDDIRRGWGGE